MDGVPTVSYQDFADWGPRDPVHTNPVFCETDNVVTRISVEVVPTVFLPGFRTLGSTGP